jgi:hypothetical protein
MYSRTQAFLDREMVNRNVRSENRMNQTTRTGPSVGKTIINFAVPALGILALWLVIFIPFGMFFGNMSAEMAIWSFVVTLGILGALWLWWLPASIAKRREHSKYDAIQTCVLCSIILWPLWLVAIIWACTEDNRGKVKPIAGELAGPRGFQPVMPPVDGPGLYRVIGNGTVRRAPMRPVDGPGLYRVIGVDRATKMDTTWRVRAESRENAKVKAELEGIVVTAIERESGT